MQDLGPRQCRNPGPLRVLPCRQSPAHPLSRIQGWPLVAAGLLGPVLPIALCVATDLPPSALRLDQQYHHTVIDNVLGGLIPLGLRLVLEAKLCISRTAPKFKG